MQAVASFGFGGSAPVRFFSTMGRFGDIIPMYELYRRAFEREGTPQAAIAVGAADVGRVVSAREDGPPKISGSRPVGKKSGEYPMKVTGTQQARTVSNLISRGVASGNDAEMPYTQ